MGAGGRLLGGSEVQSQVDPHQQQHSGVRGLQGRLGSPSAAPLSPPSELRWLQGPDDT